MSFRNFFYFLVLLCSSNLFAQFSMDNYKYVVVPYQFSFLDGNDKFRVNTLLRHLFNENGFKAYFDEEEFPQDLEVDKCLAMYADVLKLKSGFKTEVKIIIKDCDNNTIVETQSGKTKEKDLGKAYNIAIREAFETIKFIGYSYNGQIPERKDRAMVVNSDQGEIESLKREVDSLKQITSANVKTEVEIPQTNDVDVLFAQPIDGGFQLIDMEPKKVMVLLKTNTKNVYKVEGKQAIVFKKGKKWIYAETIDSQTKEKELNIKF